MTRARLGGVPALRALFTREAMLASDWYHERLVVKQRDIALWARRGQPACMARRLEHARAGCRSGSRMLRG
jgi:hypothetical protein